MIKFDLQKIEYDLNSEFKNYMYKTIHKTFTFKEKGNTTDKIEISEIFKFPPIKHSKCTNID